MCTCFYICMSVGPVYRPLHGIAYLMLVLYSRPWICYWILHSIALLGESVDADLKYNAIDFLSRCQVGLSTKSYCIHYNSSNFTLLPKLLFEWILRAFFNFFSIEIVAHLNRIIIVWWCLSHHEILTSVGYLMLDCDFVVSQDPDGGYGGGPGQVSYSCYFCFMPHTGWTPPFPSCCCTFYFRQHLHHLIFWSSTLVHQFFNNGNWVLCDGDFPSRF